jgi:hypothetical protein
VNEGPYKSDQNTHAARQYRDNDENREDSDPYPADRLEKPF